MSKIHDIEVEWLVRRLRLPRIDPTATRLWTITFAVLMGLALTVVAAFMVLTKINRMIGITVNVEAYNRHVYSGRRWAVIGGAVVIVGALFMAWIYWCQARSIAVTHPLDAAWARIKCGLCLVGTAGVIAAVAAFFRYGPQLITTP
jgi:hypothetical protein